MSSTRTQIINLLILAIAIILVCIAKSKFSELFVANVPLPFQGPYDAQGGKIANSYPSFADGVHPQNNPYQFPNQIYPARIPYHTEMGRPCEGGSCGVLGKCENGICSPLSYNRTVFNQKLNPVN